MKKPNIVLIMADQLSASFIGCYGSGVNSTPCLDELSKQGIRFERSYVTSPVCAPNRACLLTGRSPEIHGVVKNNYVLQSDNPTYANVLKFNGYKTGGFGKFHQTPMLFGAPLNLDYLGFDEVVVSEDPVWGKYIDWIKEKHPDCIQEAISITNCHSGIVKPNYVMGKMQGASDQDCMIKEEAFYKYLKPRIDGSGWERMYVSPLDAGADDSVFITDMALDFMNRTKGEETNPFFCHISYVGPHDPYDPPEPYASMFCSEDMKEPIKAEWEDDKRFKQFEDVRDNYLNFRRICNNEKEIKKMRALYHGAIKMLDDQINRVVDYLKKEELWDNTVIMFTTDHGENMGDHGLIGKGIHHYDTCIRTPLIVGGGYVDNACVSDRLTTTLDFFPTLCELVEVPKNELPPLDGKSFASIIKNNLSTQYHSGVTVTIDEAATIISDDGWRLSLNSKYKNGQLFNLVEDKTEQNNLFYNPEYINKTNELLQEFIYKKTENTMLLSQYRNTPILNGEKFEPNNSNNRVPLYCMPKAPWLEDTNEKKLWESKT